MAYTTGTTTTLVPKTGHWAAALSAQRSCGRRATRPDRLLYSEKRKQFGRKRVGCLKIKNRQASVSIELFKS